MTFRSVIDDEQVFKWSYYGVMSMVGCAALYAVYHSSNISPIKVNEAFGCYSSKNGPPILIDKHGATILQPTLLNIGIKIEYSKTGILIAPEKSVEAQIADAEYMFALTPNKNIRFLGQFFVNIPGDGAVSGASNAYQMRRFSIMSISEGELLYARAPSAFCD